jgi:polysaccharide export outer membrane protein
MTYTVDSDGNIDFPVVGKLHIAGMNREQVAAYVKDQLVSKDYVKDAVVTVEYANLGYSVLGEVSKPGRFNIDKDRITILDAISAAGDLTIYGKRENILVQREENGERKFYRVNLNSGENLYSSPVYYLQQNDIIYVEPNTMRARQSNVNGNNVLSASFWVSLASLATTITALIIK